jgi:site-specific recombinase XerD
MTYKQSTGACTLASVPRLDNFIERFIKERQYLKGVTPPTLAWYRPSFHAFRSALEREYCSKSEFKAGIIQRSQGLRVEGRGNKAVSINTYLRCLKAFLKWAYEEGVIQESVKLSWLKEEQKVLATLSQAHVRGLLAWKARRAAIVRLGPHIDEHPIPRPSPAQQ